MDENEIEGTAHVAAPAAAPAFAAAPAPQPRNRYRKRIVALVAAASILSLGSTGVGILATAQVASFITGSVQSSTTATTEQTVTPPSFGGSQGSEGTQGGNSFGYGFGDEGQTGTDDTTTTTSTAATDEQSVGVVLINTELEYVGGEAAGTGIVLSSTGEILTNNHVIEGSTTITVTVVATGETYTADVVGSDSTNDVAVLQLEDASGLAVADLDTSDTAAVGDVITGVGNANGAGTLSAAEGTVTALEQEITVSDEVTGESKAIDGLIEVNAAIVSGDSGGPLFDADGEVIGIDTAASSNTQNPTGYAIPITDALAIVEQIESGVETDTVTLGLPAFLGVELSTTETTTTSGVAIAGAIEDTPAADAGLVAGDTITAVDGETVATSTALSAAIAAHDVGDSVTLTWVDADGATQSATVVLIAGPAS